MMSKIRKIGFIIQQKTAFYKIQKQSFYTCYSSKKPMNNIHK